MKHHSRSLPAAFRPTYITLLQSVVPILEANLAHEELTKQILFFIQSNITMMGLDLKPLVGQVAQLCAAQLPYERLQDLIKIVQISVESFKADSVDILACALTPIL